VNEKRPYRLGRRADAQAETRRRIIQAAVDLHTTLGPGATSLSAIADRAGVQRHTLYAHFATEGDLFNACSGHWDEQHPFPSPERWLSIDDPLHRLRRALEDVYGWYREVEDALVVINRDAHLYPEIAQTRRQRLAGLADSLARGLPRRKAVRAAVGHAVEFDTWRSLARREGLGDRAAAELMVELVAAAASAPGRALRDVSETVSV
jgi:AcrR family transcriptional regulator